MPRKIEKVIDEKMRKIAELLTDIMRELGYSEYRIDEQELEKTVKEMAREIGNNVFGYVMVLNMFDEWIKCLKKVRSRISKVKEVFDEEMIAEAVTNPMACAAIESALM